MAGSKKMNRRRRPPPIKAEQADPQSASGPILKSLTGAGSSGSRRWSGSPLDGVRRQKPGQTCNRPAQHPHHDEPQKDSRLPDRRPGPRS